MAEPRDRGPAEPLRVLAAIAIAQLFALTLWFSATAVAPTLQHEWHLSVDDVGSLTLAVQLGFVVGALLLSIFNVADLIRSRALFAVCACLGAACNATITWLDADQFALALALRFATGAALAGVYPSGLKVMAGWFRRGRGMAMGALVGALTVGSAAPHLFKGLGIPWRDVLFTSSGLCLLGVAIMARVGDGPFETKGTAFSWRLVGKVLGNRGYRLATAGYLGHMWELYAMWAWIAAWLAASARASGWLPGWAAPLAFAVIASGGLGSYLAGRWADRVGRPQVAGLAMVMSGACSLATPRLFHSPLWIAVPLLALWGATIVADSAQFSALVTELVDDEVRGTALTLQTALGFSLTLISIRLVGGLSTSWGWQWAFPVLAIGPALGVIAMARLYRLLAARELG